MNNFYFLGYNLNWLEFVTYIIIPSSIIIMILLYIFFNYWAIKSTFSYDIEEDYDFEDKIDIKEKLDL